MKAMILSGRVCPQASIASGSERCPSSIFVLPLLRATREDRTSLTSHLTGVDLHYWGTVDFEYYHPSAATTRDGNLVITVSQENIGGLNFKSAMLQSWNKLCFQYNFYIEVNVQYPGTPDITGFWPGVWTMGNLGRPGYGASNEGTWPYTYDSCDVGTLPNQTWTNGTGPLAALNTGNTPSGSLS